MLYKTDKNGFVINEASPKRVQPYYRKILKEISGLYNEKLGDNLLSIYIRGSVSVDKVKPDTSDIDSITITKKSFPERNSLDFRAQTFEIKLLNFSLHY